MEGKDMNVVGKAAKQVSTEFLSAASKEEIAKKTKIERENKRVVRVKDLIHKLGSDTFSNEAYVKLQEMERETVAPLLVANVNHSNSKLRGNVIKLLDNLSAGSLRFDDNGKTKTKLLEQLTEQLGHIKALDEKKAIISIIANIKLSWK